MSRVSYVWPILPPDATQMLLNLKTMLGRKVILHVLHFMLWNNIYWVHSGDTILLVEDLFTLHVRCNRPRVALHVRLKRTSSVQGPSMLRRAQARKYVARVICVRVPDCC